MAEKNLKYELIDKLKLSLNENMFVKMTLSRYVGNEEALKNIYIKRVLIKNNEYISFTYRYRTKDVVKNYSFEETFSLLDRLLENNFRSAILFTIESNYIYEKNKTNKYILKRQEPTVTELPSLSHDKEKKHKINELDSKLYMRLLSLTDEKGKVLAKAQDKFKQINNYIEILSPLLKKFDKNATVKIADMGSGKGYLTFALYDYMNNVLKINTEVVGIETRKELVDFCRDVASKSEFNNLDFVESNIEDYKVDNLDVLIALHACDTATDDAIIKGIYANSSLIVIAPCCHHQVRKDINKSKVMPELIPIIKHGIFLEREAELITDTIRSLILEYFGYKTKIVEFISDAHTHKNIMIIAEKVNEINDLSVDILNRIKYIKNIFGVNSHYLERIIV